MQEKSVCIFVYKGLLINYIIFLMRYTWKKISACLEDVDMFNKLIKKICTIKFVFYLQEVVEKTHLSGDYFNTFLHQNYVDFLQSVEDVERASEYLSDADLLSAQYTVSTFCFCFLFLVCCNVSW